MAGGGEDKGCGVSLVRRGVFPGGIRKYLLSSEDVSGDVSGDASRVVRFECVVRPVPGAQGAVVSLSSQAGCSVGCPFCATGVQGLRRNLSADQIVSQAEVVLRDAGVVPSVLEASAQGEPLLNFAAVTDALGTLGELYPEASRLVSTCGVTPCLEPVVQMGARLRVTLHSAFQQVRDVVMPGAAQWSVEGLAGALRSMASRGVIRDDRPMAIVWGLPPGVNNSPVDVRRLVELLCGTGCEVLVGILDVHPKEAWVERAREAAVRARESFVTAKPGMYGPRDAMDVRLDAAAFARTLVDQGVSAHVVPSDPAAPLSIKYYRRSGEPGMCRPTSA